jgi:predicted ester cyclase
MTTTIDTARNAAVRSITIIPDGQRADFDAVIAPNAINREADIEPPACRTGGPEGFYATALWLRSTFDQLTYDIHNVIAEGDLVVVDASMSGRQVGDFVLYGPDGQIDRVWAPTRRSFTVRHAHWLRIADGMVTEHWAVRDDLGQGLQLGWMPPTPLYLLRCARATRRARQA